MSTEQFNNLTSLQGCFSTLITFLGNIWKDEESHEQLSEINDDWIQANNQDSKDIIFFDTLKAYRDCIPKNKSKLIEALNNLEKKYKEIKEGILNKIKEDNKIKHGNTKADKKTSGFRFQRKSVFLTYSQAPHGISCEDIYKKFKNLDKDSKRMDKICNNIKEFLCTKEKHEDGNPHFHVYVSFFERIDRTDPRLFDLPELNHPEIVLVCNKRTVIKYMCKHIKTDNDVKNNLFEKNMDHRFYIETEIGEIDKIGYDIVKRKISVTEAIKLYPKLIFKAESLYRSVRLFNNEVDKLSHTPKPLTDITIGENKLKFKFDPKKKKAENPQFWICGDTNSGKTYNIEQLEAAGHKGYVGSKDNDWDNYDDNHWDFVYWEEYNGENTIQFMNQFLEGTKMDLRVKYGNKQRKAKNLPCFINSNMFPHEVYKNVDSKKLNLLLQRLYIIYLDQDHNAHILWDPSKNKEYPFKDMNIECCDGQAIKAYLDSKPKKKQVRFSNPLEIPRTVNNKVEGAYYKDRNGNYNVYLNLDHYRDTTSKFVEDNLRVLKDRVIDRVNREGQDYILRYIYDFLGGIHT